MDQTTEKTRSAFSTASDERSSIKQEKYKVIFIGDSTVGKTSIINQFVDKNFKNDYKCTIGVDCSTKSVTINEEESLEMQIWDTCGQERFKTLTRQYFRDSVGAFIVFDLTNKSTFNNLESWIEDVHNYADKDISVLIVGNKSDQRVKREVSIQEINSFISKFGVKYIETSALDGKKVENVFEMMGHLLIERNWIKSPKKTNKIQKKCRNSLIFNDSLEFKKTFKPLQNEKRCCL